MELYLIRHAQSTNNALADQSQRVCDPPLTALGLRQAEAAARHMAEGLTPEVVKYGSVEDTGAAQRRGYGVTRLYCSPMRRALQTAQPISQALGLPPEVWVDIHEQGGIYLEHDEETGRVGYPGLTRAEILADFPAYRLPDAVTEQGWWRSGYEEWSVCQGRAIKVAHTLRQWAAGSTERLALVSHGGFLDALLKALLDQLPGRNLFYHHYNTAITRLDFREDGRLGLRFINRVDHLPPELVS
jgi:2,3-bisphosphoglycerate-dependent phosphoglycerate mutase